MTILDRYFELSDIAGKDETAFQELVNLFSDDAVLQPAGGSAVIGKEAIEEFFKGFFERNTEIHHVWITQSKENGLESSWAVSGKRKEGTVFALQGVDIARLDEQGMIHTLEVKFASALWLPIWVHTFSPLTIKDIQTLARLAKQYPDIPVIFGHLGGLNWLETIKIAKEIPNVYLDLSATFTSIAISLALKELPERTLFSSDAPYGDPFLIKAAIERATDDQYIKEQVLGGTIAGLLNL